MVFDLRNIFSYWESAGFFDVFLPFILVFSLVFAILERTKVFGDNKKGIHGIVALALGLMVANNTYIREILHTFLPNVAFFMIVILAFIMLVATLFGEAKFLQGNFTWLGLIIAGAFVIWSLVVDNVAEIYNIPYYLDWLFVVGDEAQALIFGAFIFLIIIVLFVKQGKGKSSEGEKEK